jgi:hypothetical protein
MKVIDWINKYSYKKDRGKMCYGVDRHLIFDVYLSGVFYNSAYLTGWFENFPAALSSYNMKQYKKIWPQYGESLFLSLKDTINMEYNIHTTILESVMFAGKNSAGEAIENRIKWSEFLKPNSQFEYKIEGVTV